MPERVADRAPPSLSPQLPSRRSARKDCLSGVRRRRVWYEWQAEREAYVTDMQRPPIEPIEPAFRQQYHSRRAARPAQAGDAGHPRDRRRQVPEREGARPARGARARAWTGRRRSPSCRRTWCSRSWRRRRGGSPSAPATRAATSPWATAAPTAPRTAAASRSSTSAPGSAASRPRPTWRTSRDCRTRSRASRSGGRRSARATAARRRSCTSWTPAGTTRSSTCRAWSTASAKPATPSRWPP